MTFEQTGLRYMTDACVIKLKTKHKRSIPRVGECWQPDLAEMLQELYPEALDRGLALEDMYRMTDTLQSSDTSYKEAMACLAELFGNIVAMEDDEDL